MNVDALKSRKVHIGQLKQSDVGGASRLFKRVIGESRDYAANEKREEIDSHSPKNLQLLLKDKNHIFKVAKSRGKVIGVLEGVLPPAFGRTPLLWVTWVIVDKNYRRRHIGSLLMDRLENGAGRRWQKIQCRIRISNSASNRMFKKLGYKIIKVHKRRVKKRTAYKWEKLLPSPNGTLGRK